MNELNYKRARTKRRFKTLGLLESSAVRGKYVASGSQKRIYEELKCLGFRETIWQYVFAGQRGGLVFQTEDGNEIHVRFYDDRIFAEYERGRAYMSHFFGPRFNAVKALHCILKGKLSKSDWKVLECLTASDRLTVQEATYRLWSPTSTVPPIRNTALEFLPTLFRKFQLLMTWQNLVHIIFTFVASIVFASLWHIGVHLANLFGILTLCGLAIVSFYIPKPKRND